MKKKGSSCMQMKDYKGKPSGLMMEGSAAYMESKDQEKKNLMKDMPIDDKASDIKQAPKQEIKEIKSKATAYKPTDNRGVGKMSPYKLTEKEKPTEELEGVTVTGDASKVGAYGKELDTIFSSIQGTLDKAEESPIPTRPELSIVIFVDAPVLNCIASVECV